MMGIPGALVIPFAPPGIQGLSTFGGFQYELLDQTGGDITRLARHARLVHRRGRTRAAGCVGLFSSFRTNDPQLVVEIDRDKARSLGLPLARGHRRAAGVPGLGLRERLRLQQPRLPRVRAGRPAAPRATPTTCAATTRGPPAARWCRSTAWCARARRRRRRSSTTSTCSARPRSTASPAPGLSSGEALRAMEQLSREALPPGFDFAWAGQSLEEMKAGAQVGLHLRAQPADRVPGAGGAVRELGAAVHHPARRAAGGDRRPRRAAAARARERRVLPGRPGDADRPRGQELDPDRGVRRAAARARHGDRGGRGRGRRASACGRS